MLHLKVNLSYLNYLSVETIIFIVISSLTHAFLLLILCLLTQSIEQILMNSILRNSFRLTLWPKCGQSEQLSHVCLKNCIFCSLWVECSVYVSSDAGQLCGYNLYFTDSWSFFQAVIEKCVLKSLPMIVDWPVSLFLYFSFYTFKLCIQV